MLLKGIDGARYIHEARCVDEMGVAGRLAGEPIRAEAALTLAMSRN